MSDDGVMERRFVSWVHIHPLFKMYSKILREVQKSLRILRAYLLYTRCAQSCFTKNMHFMASMNSVLK